MDGWIDKTKSLKQGNVPAFEHKTLQKKPNSDTEDTCVYDHVCNVTMTVSCGTDNTASAHTAGIW